MKNRYIDAGTESDARSRAFHKGLISGPTLRTGSDGYAFVSNPMPRLPMQQAFGRTAAGAQPTAAPARPDPMDGVPGGAQMTRKIMEQDPTGQTIQTVAKWEKEVNAPLSKMDARRQILDLSTADTGGMKGTSGYKRKAQDIRERMAEGPRRMMEVQRGALAGSVAAKEQALGEAAKGEAMASGQRDAAESKAQGDVQAAAVTAEGKLAEAVVNANATPAAPKPQVLDLGDGRRLAWMGNTMQLIGKDEKATPMEQMKPEDLLNGLVEMNKETYDPVRGVITSKVTGMDNMKQKLTEELLKRMNGQQASASAPGPAQSQPETQKTVKYEGTTQDGRRYRRYSDGSVEELGT
jgi:hypothetical protein